jgi:hypothetical protein
MKQNEQSAINQSLQMAAIDACQLLRLWSDNDQRIDSCRIGEFQRQLMQRFAEIHFGTHPRLDEVNEGSTIESLGLSRYKGSTCSICNQVIADDDLRQIVCTGYEPEKEKMLIAHYRCLKQWNKTFG